MGLIGWKAECRPRLCVEWSVVRDEVLTDFSRSCPMTQSLSAFADVRSQSAHKSPLWEATRSWQVSTQDLSLLQELRAYTFFLHHFLKAQMSRACRQQSRTIGIDLPRHMFRDNTGNGKGSDFCVLSLSNNHGYKLIILIV
jgi:hypothetical protein